VLVFFSKAFRSICDKRRHKIATELEGELEGELDSRSAVLRFCGFVLDCFVIVYSGPPWASGEVFDEAFRSKIIASSSPQKVNHGKDAEFSQGGHLCKLFSSSNEI
jgi:hypothetical protein